MRQKNIGWLIEHPNTSISTRYLTLDPPFQWFVTLIGEDGRLVEYCWQEPLPTGSAQ